MKTLGEIEAAICKGTSHLEQEYMGRGPKDIRAHLIGDLLVVRLQGVLTAAEQHLVKALPVEKGRDLLKQVRTQLIEVARPKLDAVVEDITGTRPLSLHHDISTITGEEIVVFSLDEAPYYREAKKKVVQLSLTDDFRRSRRWKGGSQTQSETCQDLSVLESIACRACACNSRPR